MYFKFIFYLYYKLNSNYFRMPLLDSSILNEVASVTNLFSAADLANVVKEVHFILSPKRRF